MTPPLCCGALLTRKQQWRRMGNLSTGKMNISMLPQDSTLLKTTVHQQQRQQIMRQGVAWMPSAAAPISSLMHQQQSNADPSVNRSRGAVSRPHSKAKSSRGKNRTPGEIGRGKHDLDFINDADLDKHRNRYTSAPLPLSSDTSEGKTVGGHKAERKKRVVRFDSCTRVVLVPTRRELDAITFHDVWWGPEDARQFRRSALQHRRAHGTLSGVTDEELEETGTPPGMPPFLSG